MLAETICSAVAAAGLGIAAITAYRRRFLAAARVAAYALVPAGLVMTGAVEWLARTAFSPVAWAGFGVLGLAWLLFMTTRAVERRRGGPAPAEGRRGRRERQEPRPAEPGASAPALGTDGRATAKPADDFSDIEAILKKHGI
ncbi:hypothetical protein E2C00_26040 [Streptomyces sp. WAC05374]|uniref:hypothetical protein n=1 Tax=Streptomyces sp. WAC05374 TaxID=2487420 RepID=UPI000F899177|nr:hypothetical protein [Streptomyces sp. WAC05374]RST17310.1 hypothetical protein EF905_09895 [Streptomyces sp. WAC05374]TDF43536.1 hypothetical protein E2B92_19300 [Streptomyces sp. WAC05374]TDF51562.1 hypothetical protein E2C00_26040 [Streptomyces sp. WAC05374]TDF53283.1 hypothetical protein E2C02_19935 [Streptomyces sp. WAC05374]